jgi:hypothetical protein
MSTNVSRALLASLFTTALVTGCGAQLSEFGEGRGFGLDPARGPVQQQALASQVWGVKVALATQTAQVTENDESWMASNVDRAPPEAGQFTLMVLRNARIGGQSPAAVAELLRDEQVQRGADASDIAEAHFLGRPGAMFVSSPDEDLFSVTVLTIADKCVFVLSVTRAGDQDAAAAYAADVLGGISTFDGGPASAPACQ